MPALIPDAPPALAALRTEIDALDDALIALLARRMALAHEVAAIKAQAGIPVVLAERIAAVKQRVADRAHAQGLTADYVTQLYDLIIAETCRVETDWIAQHPAHP